MVSYYFYLFVLSYHCLIHELPETYHFILDLIISPKPFILLVYTETCLH